MPDIEMPEWMTSLDGMRAEIDRRILFVLELALEIEESIDDELILRGRDDA